MNLPELLTTARSRNSLTQLKYQYGEEATREAWSQLSEDDRNRIRRICEPTPTIDPIVLEVRVKIPYYRLWLKYVTGFNEKVHCARCLKGPFSKVLPMPTEKTPNTYKGILNEHESEYLYLYLCGVTRKYSENLHIAFQWKGRSTIEYEDKRARVVITNAEQLHIPPIHEPLELDDKFTTCRNFQFGWHYLRK
jgi:hypothetical protein